MLGSCCAIRRSMSRSRRAPARGGARDGPGSRAELASGRNLLPLLVPRARPVRRSAADGREQPARSKSQRRTKPMKETRGRGRNRSPSQPRHRQACIRRVNQVTCALRFFYGVTLVQSEASRGLFRPRAREASRSHERRGSRALPGSG
jgi:hypothetical protein